MRTVLSILAAAMVIALSVWAYQENYRTQAMIGETERLQREIGDARARLSVLKAEWAYLNRPDRLRDLAEINYNDLQLLPLRPDQFGRVEQVAYPSVEEPITFENAVEVSLEEAKP
ncbi:cell division protein FtsL [Shimia sp. NS0008-38b]|uniref:cell division protein FtsL n=1 Tax=Shimia sp. NS0008-38b TaxID=3127653 RepID=UPI003107B766